MRVEELGAAAMYRVGFISTVLVMTLAYFAHAVVGPAPQGDSIELAGRMISNSGHPCPAVRVAARDSEGSIRATCANGETYRPVTINGLGSQVPQEAEKKS
jgi:hypothetical protein